MHSNLYISIIRTTNIRVMSCNMTRPNGYLEKPLLLNGYPVPLVDPTTWRLEMQPCVMADGEGDV